MASEPKVGDVRNGNDGWEMFIGSAWVWIGERAEDHDAALHISAELSAAREMWEVLRRTKSRAGMCPECFADDDEDCESDCRLARLIGGGE